MCASVHQAEHRDIVSVEAESYILNVCDKDVESGHGLLRGAIALSIVERENRYTRLIIYAASHMLAFTSGAAKTMFWGEDGGNLYAMLEQKVEGVNRVLALDHDTCMVAQ